MRRDPRAADGPVRIPDGVVSRRPDRHSRSCKPEQLGLPSTADPEDPAEAQGQERAAAALRYLIDMPRDGSHPPLMGPSGAVRHALVRGSPGQVVVQPRPRPAARGRGPW
jgi:hypothetical protein